MSVVICSGQFLRGEMVLSVMAATGEPVAELAAFGGVRNPV